MNTSLPIHSNRIIFVSTSKYQESFKRLSEKNDYYRFAFNSSKDQEHFNKETIKEANTLQYDIYNNNHVILGLFKCYYPVGSSNLWIQTLIVRKAFARKGYGTLILQRFIETLVKHYAINKIFLTCHKDNVAGISFWQQQGFVQQKERIKNNYYLYVADIRSLTCIKKFSKH